ncbi:MAG: hypothetical protein P8X68_18820 [Desulfobacterales bacterium]|jgi:hypothetical protein
MKRLIPRGLSGKMNPQEKKTVREVAEYEELHAMLLMKNNASLPVRDLFGARGDEILQGD